MPYPSPTTAYPAPTAPASNYPTPSLPQVTDPYVQTEQLPPTIPPNFATSAMQQSQLATLASLGIPLESDPNEWTLDEAEQQTQTAIAKIAQSNPELAEELLAKSQGTEQDEGFWGNLKDLAGDIVAPVLSIGAKALDIISRPAHVIPALLMNDDDPWWEDVGQALNGSDKSTWSDVLEQWGVDNPWVKGIVGFAGDVATDPLTYATFGFAGVGRAAASSVAAKTVGVAAGREALEEAAERGLVQLVGGSVDTHLTSIYDDMLKARKFAPGSEQADAVAGIAAGAVSDAERTAVTRMLEAADYVHRTVSTVGLRKMPEQLALSAGRPLAKTEVLDILNAARTSNVMSRSSWLSAKAAAGAVGGTRFRFALPFTDLRYISPALPITTNIVPFQVVRQFATGTAGMGKLMEHINGGAADWEVFRTWVDEGYSGVLKRHPEVGSALRGRGLSFGSKFYSRSESLGRITARFSPHAAAMRGGGILGTMAADFNVLAKQWEADLLNAGWTHTDEASQVVTDRRGLMDAAAKALDPAKVDQYASYRDLVPSRAADADLDKWFDESVVTPLTELKQQGTLSAEAFDERLAAAQARYEAAKQVRAGLSDAERDLLFKFRELEDVMRREADMAGASIADTTADFDTAARLTARDADEWAAASFRDTATADLYVADDVGDLHARRQASGFNPQDVQAGGVTAVGQDGQPLLTDVADSGVRMLDPDLQTRVRVRLSRPAVIDNRPIAERGAESAVDNRVLIDELRADAEQAAQRELAQQSQKLELAPARAGEKAPVSKLEKEAEALHLKTVQERADELVAEALRKRGFDGIVTYDPEGVVRAKVFDPGQVRVIDDEAPAVIRDKGYMPRQLTDEAEEFLRGKLDPSSRRTIYGAPKLVHDMHRFRPELTLAEAEDAARDTLRRRGYDVPDDLRLFERDPLKVHDKYVRRVTTSVLHEHAGYNAGRMAVAADTAPGLLGGPAGTSVYKFKVSDLPDKVLAELPGTVRKSLDVTEKAHRRLLAAQYKEGERASRSLANIRAALEGDLPPSSSLEGRAQKALGAVKQDARELGVQLDRDLNAALLEWKQVLKAKAAAKGDEAAQFAEREADLAARIKDIKSRIRGVAKEPSPATAPVSVKTAQRYEDVHESVDTFAERVQKVLVRANAEEAAGARRLQRLETRLGEAIDEQNRLIAKYRMDSARPLVGLEETIRAKTGFTQLQVRGLEHLAMPTYIAQEFHHALEQLPALNALHKEWRKWTQVWKEWATFRWPGFHVRNHMGAWFNNWIGGVNEADYRLALKLRKALAKGSDEVVDEKTFRAYNLGRVFRGRKDVTYEEWAARVSDMGVGAANARATADVRTVSEAIEKDLRNAGPRGFLRKGVEKYDRRIAMPMTETTENFHRMAGFLGGLRQTNGDFHGARMFVMMRQGDYTDLTDFEANVVKDVLPFYKWFRTNFPYQLHNIIENPALQLATLKARDVPYEVRGLDAEEARAKQPSWMQNEFAIPLPGGTDALSMVMLDLPMSDLTVGAREFVSSFLPLVRPVFESYIAEKNLFSGQPLEGKQVPLASAFNLPVVRDVLLASGLAKESADGQVMVSDKTQNLFGTLPVFSRFRNWLYAEPDRAQLRAGTLFSAALGVGIRPMDEDAMTDAELAFYYDEVEPQLNLMRDLGVQLPDADDLDPSLYLQLGLDAPAA